MNKGKINLLCVKSLLTLIIAIGFTILCFMYPNTYSETMKNVVISVVTFYFSHQVDKANKAGETK